MPNKDEKARILELEQKVAFLTNQLEGVTGLITSIAKEMQNGFVRVSSDFAEQLKKVSNDGSTSTVENRSPLDKETE